MIAVAIVIIIVTLLPDIPHVRGHVIRDLNLYPVSMEKKMRFFLTWKRRKLAGTSWTLGFQFLFPIGLRFQSLRLSLWAGSSWFSLILYTSGFRPIVLREIKALLSQARELDAIRIPSRSAVRDPEGRNDSSLGLYWECQPHSAAQLSWRRLAVMLLFWLNVLAFEAL